MSTIIMHTSEGDIKINLFDEQTPKTVENFLGLASGKKEWTDPFTGKPSHEPSTMASPSTASSRIS